MGRDPDTGGVRLAKRSSHLRRRLSLRPDIVVGSFYIKKHIGQKTWRLIHFSSLGVFLASLIHGVSAGTDTRSPIMIGLYLGSAVVVAILLAARLTVPSGGRIPSASGTDPARRCR